ncbi:MAG: hypothetical protein NTY95_17825, partial [Bacteroidia bacterium]|nr:hypothetical protein [Bacteroidia bacterium]
MEVDKIIPTDPDSPDQSQVKPDMLIHENSPGKFNSFFQRTWHNKKLMNALRIILISVVSVLIALFIFIFILYIVPGLQEITSEQKTKFTNDPELKSDQNYKK